MGGKDARYDWMQGSKDVFRNVPAKPLSLFIFCLCLCIDLTWFYCRQAFSMWLTMLGLYFSSPSLLKQDEVFLTNSKGKILRKDIYQLTPKQPLWGLEMGQSDWSRWVLCLSLYLRNMLGRQKQYLSQVLSPVKQSCERKQYLSQVL